MSSYEQMFMGLISTPFFRPVVKAIDKQILKNQLWPFSKLIDKGLSKKRHESWALSGE